MNVMIPAHSSRIVDGQSSGLMENREENDVKHVHSPSGDEQIIFLMESMQTAILCDRGISAHTAISNIRKTNEI